MGVLNACAVSSLVCFDTLVTRDGVIFVFVRLLCREMALVDEMRFVFLWPSGTNTIIIRCAMGNINNTKMYGMLITRHGW